MAYQNAEYMARQELIKSYLTIKPDSFGEVEVEIVAAAGQMSPLKRQLIEAVLKDHGSNLIPIIIRRTEAYGDDFEYEAIYGAEWVQVAAEMGVKRLKAWIMDVEDDQIQEVVDTMRMLA